MIDCTILKKLHDSWTNSNLFWLFFSFNFFVNFVFDIFQGPTYFSCTYIWRCFEGTGKTFWCHYLNNLQFLLRNIRRTGRQDHFCIFKSFSNPSYLCNINFEHFEYLLWFMSLKIYFRWKQLLSKYKIKFGTFKWIDLTPYTHVLLYLCLDFMTRIKMGSSQGEVIL